MYFGSSWVIHDQTPGNESKSTIFVPNYSRRLLRASPCPVGPLLRVYSSENGSDLHIQPRGRGLRLCCATTLLTYLLAYSIAPSLAHNLPAALITTHADPPAHPLADLPRMSGRIQPVLERCAAVRSATKTLLSYLLACLLAYILTYLLTCLLTYLLNRTPGR